MNKLNTSSFRTMIALFIALVFGVALTNAATTVGTNLATGTLTSGADGADGSITIYSEQGATDYSVVLQPHAAMTQTTTYTLPADDGAASQLLQTDGAGALSWATALTDVVLDTTPQLGGQLDVNGNALGDGTLELLRFTEAGSAVNEITIGNAATAGNPTISATGDDANISTDINAKGTGVINLANVSSGDVIIGSSLVVGGGTVQAGQDGADGVLRVYSEQGATDYQLQFSPHSAMTQHTNYVFPADDGNSGQVLSTDGGGALSWASTLSSTLTDNTTDSLDIQEGSNNYINVNTTNSSEAIQFGNATTNPTISFLGSGSLTIANETTIVGNTEIGANGTDGILSVYSEQGGTDYGFSFQPHAAMTQTTVYTMPADDGDNGQVLGTDGAGALDWVSAGAGNTLDAAYDQGGAGSGRSITVDSGAVQLTGSNAGDETLELSQSTDTDMVSALASNTAFASSILKLSANEEDNGSFYFLELISDVDGTPDTEVTIEQNGDIRTDGYLNVMNAAGITKGALDVLSLNRTTSDGDILSFQFNGAEGGTIGISGNDFVFTPVTDAARFVLGGAAADDFVVTDGTEIMTVESDTDKVTINKFLHLTPTSSPPASPVNGDMYYDDDGSDALCIYLNGSWTVAAGGGTCS